MPPKRRRPSPTSSTSIRIRRTSPKPGRSWIRSRASRANLLAFDDVLQRFKITNRVQVQATQCWLCDRDVRTVPDADVGRVLGDDLLRVAVVSLPLGFARRRAGQIEQPIHFGI